jgi:hypothetical protein
MIVEFFQSNEEEAKSFLNLTRPQEKKAIVWEAT